MKKIYLNFLLVLLVAAPVFAQGKPQCAVEVAQILAAAEKSKNYAPAIQKATECIRLNPASAEAYHQRGMAYLGQVEKNDLLKQNYDLALADFDKAVVLDPKKGDSYLKRIVIKQRNLGSGFLATLPEYNKAIEYLTASKDTATLAEAYKERAFVYALEKQSDLAIADYNTALKIKPDYTDALLLRATTFKLKEDYDAAIADYTRLLKIEPSESAYSGRGEIYEQKGDLEKALADYRAALALSPTNGYLKDKVAKGPGGWTKRLDQKTINAAHQCTMAAIQLSTTAISTKNYAPVIQKATECIGINSDSSVPYSIRARAYEDTGDLNSAIIDFNKSIALLIKEIEEFSKIFGANHPSIKEHKASLIDTYGQRSDVYLNKGETEKARTDLNTALTLDPQDYRSKDRLATLDTRAKELSEKARLASPKTSDDYVAVGRAQFNKGEDEQAISAFNTAIRLNPNNAAAYMGRAGAFHSKKDYDAALADFNKAFQLDPKNASYAGRGFTHLSKGTYDLAVADFTEALRLETGNVISRASTLTARADAYRSLNKNDLALTDYNKALETVVADSLAKIIVAPDAYLGRGKLYLALGKKDSAAADFRKVLELNPKSDAAKTELAKIDGKTASETNMASVSGGVPQTAEQYAALGRRQAGQKNYEGAVKSFTDCIILKADAAACYAFRGSVYGLTGKMNLATTDFEKAISLNPNTVAVYFIRGMMFMQLGKQQEAITDFRTVLKIDPNNQPAKQALQRLGAQQ